jgi:hypothetical protein
MEKVAYKELASHEYIHVTDFNTANPAHGKWSEEDRQCGALVITSHDGDFIPEEWAFVGNHIENGVHKDIGVELVANADPKEAAEDNPMNHY